MPAPVTVWAVELVPGSTAKETKGSLALASDALVFTPKDEERPERRLALVEIVKVRRLRGSPVLLVVRDDAMGPRRTAFYFVQPPPLDRPDEPAHPGTPFRRNTQRKARRQNVSYLGLWNREKKAVMLEWERQVKQAVAAARRR